MSEVHTLLVRLPVFFLTSGPTIDNFFATATALELGGANFSRIAALASTRLENVNLGTRVVVRPFPHVRSHPQVLRQPAVVVCLLGATKTPWKVVQISCRARYV